MNHLALKNAFGTRVKILAMGDYPEEIGTIVDESWVDGDGGAIIVEVDPEFNLNEFDEPYRAITSPDQLELL